MARINIRVLMAEKRVNQVQVSDATGIDKSTISRYYNDNFKKIDMDHIEKLCKYFECTVDKLIILEQKK